MRGQWQIKNAIYPSLRNVITICVIEIHIIFSFVSVCGTILHDSRTLIRLPRERVYNESAFLCVFCLLYEIETKTNVDERNFYAILNRTWVWLCEYKPLKWSHIRSIQQNTLQKKKNKMKMNCTHEIAVKANRRHRLSHFVSTFRSLWNAIPDSCEKNFRIFQIRSVFFSRSNSKINRSLINESICSRSHHSLSLFQIFFKNICVVASSVDPRDPYSQPTSVPVT